MKQYSEVLLINFTSNKSIFSYFVTCLDNFRIKLRFFKENSFDKEDLKEAFSYCLIGQWVLLEFEKNSLAKKTDPIVSKFKLLDINSVTVFEFLKRQSEAENFLNFSFENELETHFESVIDATINEENSEYMCSVLESLKIEEKKVSTTTPLFKRLKRKQKKLN